jgi:hypothetical protein
VLEYAFHYHAYIIEESGEWRLVSPRELLDYHALGVYTVNGENAVVMKYHVHY